MKTLNAERRSRRGIGAQKWTFESAVVAAFLARPDDSSKHSEDRRHADR